MAYSDNIGDSQPTAKKSFVSVLDLPLVTQAELEDKTSAINDRLLSGKKLGAWIGVIPTAGGSDIAVAQGGADVSDWDLISDAGAVPITPA